MEQNVFTYRGDPGHEIIFLFSADMARKDLYDREEIHIADTPSTIAVWIPIPDILSGNAKLYPSIDYSPHLMAS